MTWLRWFADSTIGVVKSDHKSLFLPHTFPFSLLVSPNNSAWQILRASRDEKAFILTTGLSPANFN
ncbi:hypothetical protein V1520DRAFT_349946 [Lipomyces starkeyi]